MSTTPADDTATTEANDMRITENTVGELSGRRVGVSNIWAREYDHDGKPVTGVAALLSIYDGTDVERREVGLGAHVTIDHDVYECVGIDDGEGDDDTGHVVLRRVARP